MGCDALEAPYFNASFVEVLDGILFVVSFGGAVTFPAAAEEVIQKLQIVSLKLPRSGLGPRDIIENPLLLGGSGCKKRRDRTLVEYDKS